ncbi:related to integral membrane protein pth11 [Cephalotrichum gorgonifer]|uniref:Related to integral membrane protein pth11 n=1 Tax=Cephalotrichum gorgonifer TaxID=2041049 RepID=A0AAE8MTP5_9PEZI|nr:related to integral membrane protein pth11 [Cephalotrichum gorgonifer]
MGFGGDAVWALSVMWFLAALVFFFLLLRLYTRLFCLASFGVDDHIYAVAFVFLLIFTIFTHISANYGFGQTMEEIGSVDRAVLATLYECIGQSFAIVGMAIAKASLGSFLLRLTVVSWHRIAIWFTVVLVSLASIAQVLCFWLSCVPLNFVYDRTIPGGSCPIDTRPTSYILCVSTIICDFFYALFPWVIIKDLQMHRREKYTIAASFSLGLIAAAAGIKRTTEVEGLYTSNYLKDSVGLIVWSSAEMAITLICIGIPVCRPLYRRIYRHFRPDTKSTGYRKQRTPYDDSSHALQTIGGGVVGKGGRVLTKSKLSSHDRSGREASGNRDDGDNISSDQDLDETNFSDIKLGVHGPFTKTRIGRGGGKSGGDDNSDEEILGDEYRRAQVPQSDHPYRGSGIVVTESYRVDRS